MASRLPSVRKLGDRFNRRRLILAGLGWFFAASLAIADAAAAITQIGGREKSGHRWPENTSASAMIPMSSARRSSRA